MADSDLYTVSVFQTTRRVETSDDTSPNALPKDVNMVDQYKNMISARIIGGKILELEHSNLAGPLVKFKTIVDFNQVLENDNCLGMYFMRQDGYIAE